MIPSRTMGRAEESPSLDQELLAHRKRVTAAWEHRRRTIERSLHDGLQQHLLALRIDLERLNRLTQTEQMPAPPTPEVEHALRRLRQVEDELLHLAAGGRPNVLEIGNLSEIVIELAEQSGLSCEIDAPRGMAPDASIAELIVSFVSESLANVLRYCGSSRVRISLCEVDGEIVVTVEDCGNGGATIRPGGGLDGLRRRAEAFGGGLRICSGGTGTQVTMQLPEVMPVAESIGAKVDGHVASPALIEQCRRIDDQVGVFEASLRTRLTSLPGKELRAAQIALESLLLTVSPQPNSLDEAVRHVEAAGVRLRAIVHQLRDSDLSCGRSARDMTTALSAVAHACDLSVTFHIDEIPWGGAAHALERFVEELLVDTTVSGKLLVVAVVRNGEVHATVDLFGLPSPTAAAFVSEIVFSARGSWTIQPGASQVRVTAVLPCES